MPPALPERFLPAYRHVQYLERNERYLAALIFGSLARGESTEASDMDVKVVVNENNPCANVNHPIIGGVKLDISFGSFEQLKAVTMLEIERRERIPVVAESLIVFDKTGELTALQAEAQHIQPKPVEPHEYQFMQFMFYHGNNKVERNLHSDPITALFVMHVGLNDFLHYHYRLQQRWWVSSKRLLVDLRNWDTALVPLIEQFVATSDVQVKFQFWSAIIDHILQPLGGRQPIEENNCECEICQRDLGTLLNGHLALD
jgi:hypothetical protein